MNASDELRQLEDTLSRRFAEVSLRGQGRGCFLFARHRGRAVEIAANDGKWWLEFWDADPNSDAAPVKKLTLETPQDAASNATDWLDGDPGHPVLTIAARPPDRASGQ